MNVDLKTALPIVEHALEAASAKIGPVAGFADSAYFARRNEVMKIVAAELGHTVGARINDSWNGCRVRIAGVSSTCTAGMYGALQNWIASARRKEEA